MTLSRTRTIMLLDLLKLVLLFGGIVALSPLGPVWTAASVGIAFGGQSLVKIALVIHSDGLPAWPLASALLRPLAACGAMTAAVLGARHGASALGVTTPAAMLPIEIAVGAVTYIVAAVLRQKKSTSQRNYCGFRRNHQS